ITAGWCLAAGIPSIPSISGGSLSDAHFERLSPSHVRFGGTITSYAGVFSGSRFLDLSVKDFNATA
ncbi:hypothetical protein NPS74_06390, partial [Cutibacterium acnes subsp. acnes]|nr:hypothetical protein [Cutibacterium acnes subsp. acnes]